jgi:hypothetical protein
MEFYSQSAPSTQQAQPSTMGGAGTRGDLVYQVMTIAAMLIVLVSAWVF